MGGGGGAMSKNYSAASDVTAKQPASGSGMSMHQMFLCGHRASSTGARFRTVPGLNPIAWRCPACNTKGKA